MKICVDVRCLSEGRRTGVEEYTLGLLKKIFEIDKENEYILFFNSWKKPKFDFTIFSKYKNVTLKSFKIPNKLLNFCFWYLNWPKIDKLADNSEIVFLPNIIFNAVSRQAKLITTIHDLSFERHPEYFSFKRRLWHLFINPRKICQKSNNLVAVSSSTKNDLIELYKTPTKKISVIHNAVSENFCLIDRNVEKLIRVKEKYNLPYKFILFLGTIEPRKNIVGLIRGFNALQKEASGEIKKCKLVIAGESGWKNKEIYSEIEKSEFKKQIQVINFVEEKDKAYLYNLASLFVYPSFFEGFGFPPLEAMQCGTPVIGSHNSSLPEILGEAAILINPDKPDEIFRAMKEILNNSKLKEKLIQKGLEKTNEFSWGKTARETLKVILKK